MKDNEIITQKELKEQLKYDPDLLIWRQREMMDKEEIRKRLKDFNFTAVAKSSGVNYHVLYKFMKGEDPRHSTVTMLSAYLNSLEGKKNDK